MFLMSLYAIAVTLGLGLYWILHNLSAKFTGNSFQFSISSENQCSAEESGGCSSGVKVQLKEVHHSNETASVQVITPEGITLVQANEKKIKRRPAPPPPPKQPPKRPPAPPPPLTQVVVEENLELCNTTDTCLTPSGNIKCSSSPSFPGTIENERGSPCDAPSPSEAPIKVQPRSLDGTSLVYPKNSYMSYRSERKMSRQGFDGKYQRSFLASASFIDLTSIENNQIKNISCEGWEPINDKQSNCLLRSCSQDNVSRKALDSSDDISSEIFKDSKMSSNCLTSEKFSQDTLHRAVPCELEQDETNFVVQSWSSTTSEVSQVKLETIPICLDGIEKNSDSVVESECLSLDDNLPKKSHEIPQNTEKFIFDHNQNSLHNSNIKKPDFKSENNINTEINSVNLVTIIPNISCELIKTKEELNCEKLARDFIQHYGDIAVKNLFVPAPNHKTLSDYIDGLLNLELLQNHHHCEQNSTDTESMQCDQNSVSKKISSFEGKKKIFTVNDNQNYDIEATVQYKKDELIISIKNKLDSLRKAQDKIGSEILQNEQLGQEIKEKVKELADPVEFEKYILHVDELQKIVSLLLSLSARLARAENILKTSEDCSGDEKKMLESKLNKLKEQHEDACRLKENIDKRSNHVSSFLHKYFSSEEYTKYDFFIKMKTKFLVDLREIEEKINLGEEQLAALSVVTHLWKSANL